MDPDRIQQVITNLVQNAVKYAAEGGRIDLGVSADENDIMIEVRDHGKGIGPKEQEVLLTKDRPGKREDQAQGTGLGLILCRQIVQAHNGRIVLNSRPGMGSAFEVYLPLTGRMQVKD
jgi:signal transduction histidine kinase